MEPSRTESSPVEASRTRSSRAMSLGALCRLPLAVARALLAALCGQLGALCWNLAPLSLSLPGWRRVSAPRPTTPAGMRRERDDWSPTPTSVNYHFTRQCNYKCGFCFHTAKTSFVLPLEEAKRGLAMLKEAGEPGGSAGGSWGWGMRRGHVPAGPSDAGELLPVAARPGSLFISLQSGTDRERATGRQRVTAFFFGPFLGMEKINFSGGEPFLQDRGEFVGKLVQFCKQELKLPSVSIVSNGSLIRERWFKKYGKEKHKHWGGLGASSGQPHQRWFSVQVGDGLLVVHFP